MKTRRKGSAIGAFTAALKVKAAGEPDDMPEGTFTAYASVFGVLDSYRDIVEPGAFAATLEEWRASDDPIPLLWGHDMYDAFSHLGSIDPNEVVEDETGLLVKGTLDLDNPTAMQVWRLIKGRRVTQMSFGYETQEEERVDDANHLLKVHLIEISIVPRGANPATDILDVKASLAGLAIKAGRVLSAANETALRSALSQIADGVAGIEAVLAATDAASTDNGDDSPSKASTGATGKAAIPSDDPNAKASGQAADNAADDLAQFVTAFDLHQFAAIAVNT